MRTGRRAWRKWAKKQRYKTNRALRRSGAEYRNDATGAWYKGQRAFFEQRPSVAVKYLTPRSLVGMTQGARKRKARSGVLPAHVSQNSSITPSSNGIRTNRRHP